MKRKILALSLAVTAATAGCSSQEAKKADKPTPIPTAIEQFAALPQSHYDFITGKFKKDLTPAETVAQTHKNLSKVSTGNLLRFMSIIDTHGTVVNYPDVDVYTKVLTVKDRRNSTEYTDTLVFEAAESQSKVTKVLGIKVAASGSTEKSGYSETIDGRDNSTSLADYSKMIPVDGQVDIVDVGVNPADALRFEDDINHYGNVAALLKIGYNLQAYGEDAQADYTAAVTQTLAQYKQ